MSEKTINCADQSLDEERYRSLFNRVPVGMYRSTPAGQILDANPAMVRLLGYPDRTSLLATNAADLYLDAEERTRFKELIAREGTLHAFETRMLRHDGTPIWVQLNSRAVENADGRVFYEGTIEDISKRMQTEKALRESLQTSADIVQAIPAGLFTYQYEPPDRLILLDGNSEAERLTGIKIHDWRGKDFDEIWPQARAYGITQAYLDVVKTGQMSETADQYYEDERLAGTFRTRVFAMPGSRLGVAFENITEIKSAEKALRQERDLLSRVMETSPAGIIVVDRRGQITFANDRAEQVLGLTKDKITQRTYNDAEWHITDYDGNPFPDEQLPFQRVMATGQPVYDVHHAIEWPNGQQTLLTINAAPLLDETGKIDGVVALVEDVTEQMRAEEALQKSEERFRSLYENTTIGLYRTTPQGRVLMANPAALRMLGYSCFDEVAQRNLEEGGFAPSHPRSEFRQKLEREGVVTGFEGAWIRPDGSTIFVRESAKLVRDENGDILYYDGTFEDITERKEMEQALHLTQFCVDRASIGIMRTGAEARILSVNEQMCQALGYTAEELCSMHVYDIDPTFPLERWKEHRDHLRGHGSDTFETVHRRKDGTTFPVEITNNYIEFQGNGFSISFVRDITERKRAEEERERLLAQVQEQAQRIQQIMDTVPEGVILLDNGNHVVLANPLGRRDLDVLAETLVGGTLLRLGNRPLVEFLTSPPEGLWHEVSADGQTFQVIARSIEEGTIPKGWVLVIRNVTQQYEVEQRVQQQERLASVGQLAAGIAHDFNNIMAVITLYAGMALRAEDLSPKVHERLGVIDQQARRASGLIQQIMDFSRRAVLERGPMDMLAFLKEQVKLLQRTLPESINVEMTCGQDEYTVDADPTRMQQVIVNLATNARDAMPQGGQLRITLDKVQIEEDDTPPLLGMRPGDWVCVRVADTGTGISPDVLPHIYDPFFTTKEPGKGTGLGLAQVYGIVKQHEGHIDVHTKVGKGTAFILYLPALSLEQPHESQIDEEFLSWGKGQVILVVEDNAAARSAVVTSLELMGYQVLEASDGQEALDVFEAHADQIALVLSDMIMPKMSGQALFHALVQRDPEIKMLLLTGHPLREEEMESLQAQGLNGWLQKPPSLEKLARVVARTLEAD
jgi:two-component system cell cycle sensor histidine kinase/response regulator CckA